MPNPRIPIRPRTIRPTDRVVEGETDQPADTDPTSDGPTNGGPIDDGDVGGAVPRILVVDDEPAARTLVT